MSSGVDGANPVPVLDGSSGDASTYVKVGTRLVANGASSVTSTGGMNIPAVNGVAEFNVGTDDITVNA